MPPALLEQARAKARTLGTDLGYHIRSLIEADLRRDAETLTADFIRSCTAICPAASNRIEINLGTDPIDKIRLIKDAICAFDVFLSCLDEEHIEAPPTPYTLPLAEYDREMDDRGDLRDLLIDLNKAKRLDGLVSVKTKTVLALGVPREVLVSWKRIPDSFGG